MSSLDTVQSKYYNVYFGVSDNISDAIVLIHFDTYNVQEYN